MDLKKEISKVAYELYEKSGRAAGKHADHWFEAEKIVMARLAEEKALAQTGAKGLAQKGAGIIEKLKKTVARKPAAKKPAAKKTAARKTRAKTQP
jgi:hypothetical protein